MQSYNVTILEREWANPDKSLEYLTIADPDTPSRTYRVGPCANTTQAEAAAIAAFITAQAAAGLAHPGPSSDVAPETVTVTAA